MILNFSKTSFVTALVLIVTTPLAVQAKNETTPDEIAAASTTPLQTNQTQSWSLGIPKEDKVIYKGIASFDNVEVKSPHMMYPAPNLGGFIVGVIAHGLITDSQKEKQKRALQANADKVLLPLKPLLDTFTYKELMQRGLKKLSIQETITLAEFSEKKENGWRIESTPIFSLSPDRSALLIDNVIAFHRPSDPAQPVHKHTVRVVSRKIDAAEPVDYWMGSDGEKIKDESARIFAESLDIAFNSTLKEIRLEDHPQKTVRYFEGNTEKMERGHVLGEQCGQVLIKNLRGELMSLPGINKEEATPQMHCNNSASIVKKE